MVSITATIKQIEKAPLPNIYRLFLDGEKNEKIIVEYHEKLGLEYKEKENVKLVFTKTEQKDYTQKDYCGTANLFSIKEEGEGKNKKYIYIFSMGGYIIRIESPRKIREFEISKDYFFCAKK